jgi:hypothetical protein
MGPLPPPSNNIDNLEWAHPSSDVDNSEWAHQYAGVDDLNRPQADVKDRHQV